MCENDNNMENQEGDEDMAKAIKDTRLAELRKSMRLMNKDIPVLKSGKNGAIELNPKNPSHKDWYEGR